MNTKIHLIRTLLIFFLVVSYSMAEQLVPEKTAVTRVVCVGDSITAGPYPAMLKKALGEGWVTVNCGKGAATIIDGSFRPYATLPEYQKALAAKPDVVIIMLGTNDANPRWWDDADRKTNFKGPPDQEFRAGYLALIDAFAALPTRPQILMATPMPIFPEEIKNEAKRAEQIGRRAHLINDVIPIIREIAADRKLPLVDLQTLMADQKEHCRDGVHYTAAGYQNMANAFKVALLER